MGPDYSLETESLDEHPISFDGPATPQMLVGLLSNALVEKVPDFPVPSGGVLQYFQNDNRPTAVEAWEGLVAGHAKQIAEILADPNKTTTFQLIEVAKLADTARSLGRYDLENESTGGGWLRFAKTVRSAAIQALTDRAVSSPCDMRIVEANLADLPLFFESELRAAKHKKADEITTDKFTRALQGMGAGVPSMGSPLTTGLRGTR